jgi:hypothetical protein
MALVRCREDWSMGGAVTNWQSYYILNQCSTRLLISDNVASLAWATSQQYVETFSCLDEPVRLDMSPSLAARHGWYTRTRTMANGMEPNGVFAPGQTTTGVPAWLSAAALSPSHLPHVRQSDRSSRRPWRAPDFYHLPLRPASVRRFGWVSFFTPSGSY